jgi:hypothetical protein
MPSRRGVVAVEFACLAIALADDGRRIRLALATVLLVVLPAALLAAILVGVGMCRLAALSDRHHAVALAEWIAASHRDPPGEMPTQGSAGQLRYDRPGEGFRAAG